MNKKGFNLLLFELPLFFEGFGTRQQGFATTKPQEL